jgi:hypothetical protein
MTSGDDPGLGVDRRASAEGHRARWRSACGGRPKPGPLDTYNDWRLSSGGGVRFFDPGGQFTDAFPASIQPQTLGNGALLAVRQFKLHARFQPATRLTEVFVWRPECATGRIARVPTLEVTLEEGRLSPPGPILGAVAQSGFPPGRKTPQNRVFLGFFRDRSVARRLQ